ncbi:uncharacterized protein LOC110264565 [Arachis ipaensis]|uniref:uncharacterized protein LOC110264565 n=1 Tax=Arachis ipaensis TaxID=130454 RepID=UPI000A2B6823|nr:uncharacterized protein LOC110264565 [Arachis ipaensis]
MTRRIGMEGMEKFIQIVASRLMCVGRTTELLGAKQKVAVDRVSDLEKSLKEKDDIIVDVTAKLKEFEEEVVRLRDQVRLLQAEVKENDKTKEQLTSSVHELEEEGMEMFSSSFDRAVSQIAVLAPEFDCDQLDVTKIVIGGKLVVDGTVEDYDKNVPPF